MRTFSIQRPDQRLRPALVEKIDNLTKPKGSLGRLEELALQIGLIQQTLSPTLSKPQNVLFAADHGIEREHVSLSPRAVTWQQTLHFVEGTAGINFLCRQHGFALKVVDAGVDCKLPDGLGIIDRKVRRGTGDFLYEPAMSPSELEQCIESGAEIVRGCHEEGTNVISFGEMGIGNTSSSSVWMHLLTGVPLMQCIGAGSGLDEAGMRHKRTVLQQAVANYRGDGSTLDILRYFGGFEMLMAVGGMLQAAELGMTVLVDGFIMTNCLLAASRLYPEVAEYAVFCHCGDEAGHRLLLEQMHARPLLSLGFRLGEGTGAVCAYPLVESAVRMLREMDSFSEGAVTKYF